MWSRQYAHSVSVSLTGCKQHCGPIQNPCMNERSVTSKCLFSVFGTSHHLPFPSHLLPESSYKNPRNPNCVADPWKCVHSELEGWQGLLWRFCLWCFLFTTQRSMPLMVSGLFFLIFFERCVQCLVSFINSLNICYYMQLQIYNRL